jgi:hypothetical protein
MKNDSNEGDEGSIEVAFKSLKRFISNTLLRLGNNARRKPAGRENISRLEYFQQATTPGRGLRAIRGFLGFFISHNSSLFQRIAD